MIGQVLEHCYPRPPLHPAGGREELGDRDRRGPVHRRHCAAVQVEARDLLEQLRRPHVGRHVRIGREHVGQSVEPLLGEEEGPGPVPGGEGAAQNPRRLRDVEPLRGLAQEAQPDVRQARVVADAGIVGRGEPDDLARLPVSHLRH